MPPSFIIVTELNAGHPDLQAAHAQVEVLTQTLTPQLGFTPSVGLASLPPAMPWPVTPVIPAVAPTRDLQSLLEKEASEGDRDIFVVPAILDFGVQQKAHLAEIVAGARQQFPHATIAYDDVDSCHPLLVEAWAQRIYQQLARSSRKPEEVSLLITASGDGASSGRAQSYRLMRLLWEQVGCATGEVGFCRHAQPSLREQLSGPALKPLSWVIVPQAAWHNALYDQVQATCEDLDRAQSTASSRMLIEPIGRGSPPPCGTRGTPELTAWLAQRILGLWNERRNKSSSRATSAHRACCPQISRLRGPRASKPLSDLPASLDADLCYGSGRIAEIYDETGLTQLLSRAWNGLGTPIRSRPDEASGSSTHVFIKVTWHGYAPGTYTDPVALDMLLGALPGRAVLLEGHTSSRNLGGATWDWTTDSRQHRTWIAEQEAEYLRRTGLAEVIRKHKAQYLNVTEAFWDGECAPREQIERILRDAGVTLRNPELAAYVPEVLLAHRGAPFISFARFKGSTRLGVANMFGLIPDVLRTAWHGPDITHFARVCCDMAKLYDCLFQTHGMVEGLHAAVRWNPQGLYRSRWGNYDLIAHPGLVTFSQDLATGDVLASRLQGSQVMNSSFFRVLREELGFSEASACLPIPQDLVLRLA